MKAIIKICLFGIMVHLFSSCSPCSLNRANEIQASEISKFVFSLQNGETLKIETVGISEGSDPVLHLLKSESGEQVAYDDNSGQGLAAKLEYTATNSKTGKYILIVRSKNEASIGTCNLLKNLSLWKLSVAFGGTHLRLGSLNKDELIETIKPPDGPHGHILLVMNSSKNNIKKVVEGGYNSRYRIPNRVSCQNFIFGKIEVEDKPHGFDGNKLRVFVNDFRLPNRDLDNDGLGDALEKAIGTCSDLTSNVKGIDDEYFDCYFAADPRDTDGDGISDSHELLGKRGRVGLSIKQLPLPTWGADPRHKDYFLELDYMRTTKNGNDNQIEYKMYPIYARNFAKIFADSFETSPFFQLYNAKVLRNPDNKPGINAHLDVGIAPERADDLGKYGDWKGFNAVDAVQKPNGDWGGVNTDTAWEDNMDPFRRGIFKYSLGVTFGGGKCGIGAFSCFFNFHDRNIPAHETGHSLGIGHSGIAKYYDKIDPNCNPGYLSVMNYAYVDKSNMGFSSRPQYAYLNNNEVEEWESVSPDAPFFPYLTSTFKYYVDPVNGHVDWNRDGVFAPQGAKVKAYINYAPDDTSCEYTRYNQMDISEAESDQAPVLAKLNNKLYIFYKPLSNIDAIKYKTSSSNWDCPVPAVNEGCNNGTWSFFSKNALLGSKEGLDIAPMEFRPDQRLLLVTNWVNGFLWYNELSVSPNGTESWSPVNLIPNSTKAVGTPSLAVISPIKLMLSYKGEDMVLRYRYYRKSGSEWVWTEEQIAKTDMGIPIEISQDASPSLQYAQLEWNNNELTMYGAFVTGNANLVGLWALNKATNRWENTELVENIAHSAVGKPEMAWVPAQGYFEGLGRLYLLYSQRSNNNNVTKMLFSYHNVDNSTGERKQVVGLESYFDNEWAYSLGFDIFFDSDYPNSNLKYIGVVANGNGEGRQISFRPKADAINNFTYHNLNDWETMGNFLCRTVVNPGGTVINPIICHDN